MAWYRNGSVYETIFSLRLVLSVCLGRSRPAADTDRHGQHRPHRVHHTTDCCQDTNAVEAQRQTNIRHSQPVAALSKFVGSDEGF